MVKVNNRQLTCSNCSSRQHSIFTDMQESSVNDLESVKLCSFYKKKQSIFLEGSIPRGVYCINKGKAKIFARGQDGKEQIIHFATDGEVMGFRAMFSGEPYSVSAETIEESNICFIPKDNFLNMIDSSIALRNNIFQGLSKELSDRTKLLTNMAQKSVRERLAFSLIFLDKIYIDEPINLSREDLANFVGTATETLIRLLKEFKDENLIKIKARKLTILNKDVLFDIAGN